MTTGGGATVSFSDEERAEVANSRTTEWWVYCSTRSTSFLCRTSLASSRPLATSSA
jgi:hypothetical protein